MTVIVTAWVTAGICLWFSCLRHGDLPSSWTSEPRRDGWAGLLFFYLPASIVFAPFLWAWALYEDLR